MKPKLNYDKDHDILSIYWGEQKGGVKYSEEVQSREGHEFVIDYDNEGRIVGIEIFDWGKKRI